MKIYLVGGAVRDQLLGLPIKEKDWVVVGATVNDMLKQGFRQVGKDFPVFLHPITHEEYALARVERKIGRGYTGFEFDTSTSVTLEEDLKRRDITINAIAKTAEGDIIDPYHGQADLKNNIIRHVSPAFAEDPVRILRVARFAARFKFKVADETLHLMQSMVTSGEVNALVAERVWKELDRALGEHYPDQFFKILATCGALPILFPMIHYPGDGINALLKAAKLSSDLTVRFAALFHLNSKDEITTLCDRYRIPNAYREAAQFVSLHLRFYQHPQEATAENLFNFFKHADAFRREKRFHQFLTACEAASSVSQTKWLLACFHAAQSIDIQSLGLENSGKEIGEKIKEKRILAIAEWLKNGESHY